jgi:hypothetical protein
MVLSSATGRPSIARINEHLKVQKEMMRAKVVGEEHQQPRHQQPCR